MKPQLVEAMQLTKTNREEVIKFVGQQNAKTKAWDPKNLYLIKSNNEDDFVEVGYYVLKRADGRFEVIAPHVFEGLYEVAQEGLKK